MNRSDFQRLADERVTDAQSLLVANRWAGAYYLAGYAAEFALKACIARLTLQHDFPDKTFAQKCYTHDIESLVELAGLKGDRDIDVENNEELGANWLKVKDWNESARYQEKSEEEAKELCIAIFDESNGVMQWIKKHW